MGHRHGFKKLPDTLRLGIQALINSGESYVLGRVVKVARDDVADGLWDHLGFGLEGDIIVAPPDFVPLPTSGRWSNWNVNGRVIIRKDLPKVDRTFSWESPNFGDWSKGSHTVSQARWGWAREILYGKGIQLRVEILSESDDSVQVRIFWSEVFDVLDNLNERDVLLAASVLRENAGGVSAFSATEPADTWIVDEAVDWEILPPGERGKEVARQKLGVTSGSAEDVVLSERFDFIESLNAESRITGRSGFNRYFGAKFADDLVMFENIRFGNAIYIMFDRWQEMSQRSRSDLLSGQVGNFERVVHRGH